MDGYRIFRASDWDTCGHPNRSGAFDPADDDRYVTACDDCGAIVEVQTRAEIEAEMGPFWAGRRRS